MQTHDSTPVLKISTSRRTFLKGALIAASTPAVALAPAIAFSVSGLIADHAVADEMYYAADEIESAIGRDPKRPTIPHIAGKDFGPYYQSPVYSSKTFYLEMEIEAVFDGELQAVHFNAAHLPGGELEKRLASIEDRRQRALTQYRGQRAVYDKWADVSGYRKAGEETARLADVVGKIEDRILKHRCDCLDDVRAKAAFFDRMYGKTAPEGFIDTFVKSLIA